VKSALYQGRVFHHRHTPRHHRFSYRFFMWFLNLDELDRVPDLSPWFSVHRFALSRFRRTDYLGPAHEPLHVSVKKKMADLTGKPVTGPVCGLMNVRTLGLYFSPVNFYFGYDQNHTCTHLLAEVSNTPWNERHCYAHDLSATFSPDNPKVFHVSPFNPVHQHYQWSVTPPPAHRAAIRIRVDDSPGPHIRCRRDPGKTAFHPAVGQAGPGAKTRDDRLYHPGYLLAGRPDLSEKNPLCPLCPLQKGVVMKSVTSPGPLSPARTVFTD
jgi:uncharacterized protein